MFTKLLAPLLLLAVDLKTVFPDPIDDSAKA